MAPMDADLIYEGKMLTDRHIHVANATSAAISRRQSSPVITAGTVTDVQCD